MTTGVPEREETSASAFLLTASRTALPVAGLSYLILLNGVAAIVMVGAFVLGFQTSAEPKLAAAMLVFGIGAVAGLVSSFIAYLNRIIRAEMPERRNLPSALRLLAIAAVIGSGAAFLSGIAMVGTTSTARSSSQPKTKTPGQGLGPTKYDATRTLPASLRLGMNGVSDSTSGLQSD